MNHPATIHVFKEVASLLELGDNWDSYGAEPIDPKNAALILRVAAEVFDAETDAPHVAPTNNGGIDLDWSAKGLRLQTNVEAEEGLISVARWKKNAVLADGNSIGPNDPLFAAKIRAWMRGEEVSNDV